MSFRMPAFPILVALAASTAMQAPVAAQRTATTMQRTNNAPHPTDLRARIGTTDARIAAAQRSGKITRSRAARLRRQVAQAQTSLTQSSRRQGFVSAAEFASYERALGVIDAELDRRGVARSYGNDMLVAPDSQQGFRYDCQHEPIAVSIPGQRLDDALQQLRLATRCPISGTGLAGGKRSQPVAGTMTPTAALQAMLGGTGLEGNTIKGGFQITRLPR